MEEREGFNASQKKRTHDMYIVSVKEIYVEI